MTPARHWGGACALAMLLLGYGLALIAPRGE